MTDDPITDFFKANGCTRIAYLGDGAYCGFDGYQTILATARDAGPLGGITVHYVAIDASVATALIKYLRPTIGLPREKEGDD